MDGEDATGAGASCSRSRRPLLEAVAGLARIDQVDELLSRTVVVAAELVAATRATLEVLDPQARGVSRPFLEYGEPAPAVGSEELGGREGTGARSRPLSVAVEVRGVPFAELCLSAPAGGAGFAAADEGVLIAVAAAVGVMIENIGLHREASHRDRWLAASAEITATLIEQASELAALQLIADRARELAGARVSWVFAGPDVDHLELRVTSGADVDIEYMRTLPLDRSLATSVLARGEPLRVAQLTGDQRIAPHGLIPGWPDLGPAIVVPLEAVGVRGVLGLGWDRRDRRDRGVYERLDTSLPAGFAQQASLALAVYGAHQDQRQLAVLRDRDRIGRDLHDVVIQRLFAIGLGLESLGRLPADQRAARVDDSVEQIDETIRDLRGAIHALRRSGPARDVQEQVTEVVAWAEPVLGFRPVLRFVGPVRTGVPEAVVPDLLAVLSEAISNAGRHAGARALRVELEVTVNPASAGGESSGAESADEVVLTVRDDGRGLAGTGRESGLANLRHRAVRLGGRCTIAAAADRGTRVEWRVPVAPTASV